MSLRARSPIAGTAAVLASLALAPSDARACGGCFPPESDSTVVTGHRMALSISSDRTVLWDQIEYAGNPEEFAWVLPVKPGAYLELGSDAFFEALDGATAANVVPPSIYCPWDEDDYGYGYDGGSSGCSCGGPEAGDGAGTGAGGGLGDPHDEPPPVTVVHQETIGPYETVTIHSNVPGSLYTWLADHGYAVGDPIKPVIDDYEAEGFDFIALRLIPGESVQQMQPVRVVTPGASPVLPLRMVAAGTGANVALTLFVIGEGRWEAQNFPNNLVDTEDMSWDFNDGSSNYDERRNQALAGMGSEGWLSIYAYPRSLLSPASMPAYPGGSVFYFTGEQVRSDTISGLYMRQGAENGADVDPACFDSAAVYGDSMDKVVDPCGPDEGSGGAGAGGSGGAGAGGGSGECSGTVGPNEIDAHAFHCGSLDDIGVALTGLHPASVWVTRLEANLPQAALGQDLSLQAEATQTEQHNWIQAEKVVNPPCSDWKYGSVQAPPGGGRKQGPPSGGHRDLVLFGVAFAGLASAVARRLARPSPVRARSAR